MGNMYRKCQVNRGILLLIVLGLTACTPTSSTVVPVASVPPALPHVTFTQTPDIVCQSAAQIRLVPRITGAWPREVSATWQLTASSNSDVLDQGTFSPEAEHLFIPFPEGKSLPPGDYTLTLYLQDTKLAEHTFSVSGEAPAIRDILLTLTPAGPIVSKLANHTYLFYLQIIYEGACPGAPLWVSVRHKEQAVCVSNKTVSTASGTHMVPCYRAEGNVLEPGTYRVDASLMGQADAQQEFEVEAPPPTSTPTLLPTPTPPPPPTPTPHPLTCKSLFAATGLKPEGQPFLPQEIFDWYSQSIYVGSQCQHIPSDMAWQSAWYRNGETVRETQGVWTGGPEGTVWDSITGAPGAPLLLPGDYTVTLTLAATTELTTSFHILYYPQPTPASP